MDAPVGDVDLDGVALFHQADGAAGGRFRRGVADRQPEVPPEKRPSVSSAQTLPRPFDFR
jgi:hypothetical protein